jgi:hypothetical protein
VHGGGGGWCISVLVVTVMGLGNGISDKEMFLPSKRTIQFSTDDASLPHPNLTKKSVGFTWV